MGLSVFSFIGGILKSIGLILFVILVYILCRSFYRPFQVIDDRYDTGLLFFQIEGYIVMSMMSTSYAISDSGITTTPANPPEWLAYTIGYNIQLSMGAYITRFC
jgi:Na+/proline symporter